ncbi:hypothetical protein TNCV_3988841 [Trichonephila clavipes]|nr:hypothetical protein TNCV_3988841 [Trichonephila clavipes]
MDACKCIVHGGTLHSRRSTSSLVRLVKEGERWEVPDYSQSVFPQNWGGNEQNRAVTCMVPKAKINDRRKTLALGREEFGGP